MAERLRDSSGQEREEVVRRHGDLEIEEDMTAQRRMWRFERILRLLAVVLLVLALLGVFGGGLFSRGEAGERGLTVSYERIAYYDTEEVIKIRLAAEFVRDGKAVLAIDKDTFESVRSITPRPRMEKLSEYHTALEFELAPAGGEIVLMSKPHFFGPHQIGLGVEGGPQMKLRRFILP